MKKESSLVSKLIIPIVVVLSLIAVLVVSRKQSNPPSNESASTSTTEISRALYIEDIPGPHSGLKEVYSTSCQSCHDDQFSEWRRSPHADSALGVIFQTSLEHAVANRGREVAQGCFGCHVPMDCEMYSLLPGDMLNRDSTEMHDGVSCYACHSRQAGAAPCPEGATGSAIPSPTSPEFCAVCHNQKEPVLAVLDPELAQAHGVTDPGGNPYAEWLESEYSQPGEKYVSCLDCHGQKGTGTVHRWPKDELAMLREAYSVEELPVTVDGGEMTARIRVTNTGAGHRFPTGDPGRMVVITVKIVDRAGNAVAESSVTLARYVSLDFCAGDTRLAPGQSIDATVTTRVFPWSKDELDVIWLMGYGYDPITLAFLRGLGLEPESILLE